MRLMLGLMLLMPLLMGAGSAAAPPFEGIAYRCERARGCQRIRRAGGSAASEHPSLQACRLVCSAGAGLWPIPTGPTRMGHAYLPVDPRSFSLSQTRELSDEARAFLSKAMATFEGDLRASCSPPCRAARTSVRLQLNVESSSMRLGWESNEAYNLEIAGGAGERTVLIRAQSVYGARHGLETLSQLIAPVPGGLVMLDEASVRDKPVFRHRGLLIDTARNFMPVRDILRTIDGLASVKMNVLHWHASDSQSFPLEIRSVPQMASYGAYGSEQVYSVEDMQRIARYANSKGVRLIVEIDGPSHAGAGWQWGPQHGLGDLALCVERQPWREFCVQPPCGQLNPVNSNTSRVLRSLYRELLATFGRSQLMHLGGDELFVNCWNASEEVTRAMERMGMGRTTEDFLKLWSGVHRQQLRMLDEESGQDGEAVIVWSSQLTAPERIEAHLDKRRFVVQTWVEAGSALNEQLLSLGYRLLVSTKDAWYLDHGFWGRTAYHSWRNAYDNRIPRHPELLGGEACLWTEYVSSGSLDGRIWPRAAAVAERLWSDPEGPAAQAESRLQAHVDRLRSRQLRPEAIAPQWCDQHEGHCH